MSSLAHRAAPAALTGLREPTRVWPDVVVTPALVGLAVLLVLRWWQEADGVPLSWGRASLELLLLLPALPVLGLLSLRTVASSRGPVAGHLARATSRWAAVWATVTAAWVLATVTRLYGTGIGGLLHVDNLGTVLGASDVVGTRLTAFWVALLVALFGRRLSPVQAFGVLSLVCAVLLAVAPDGRLEHGHGNEAHPLVQVVAGVELVTLALWSGTLAATFHLRRPVHRSAGQLERWGSVLSAAVVALGSAVVVGGAVRPVAPVPVALAAAQLAAVAAIALVGQRHRRRTLEVVSTGPPALLVALVLGELLVLAAAAALGVLLPLG